MFFGRYIRLLSYFQPVSHDNLHRCDARLLVLRHLLLDRGQVRHCCLVWMWAWSDSQRWPSMGKRCKTEFPYGSMAMEPRGDSQRVSWEVWQEGMGADSGTLKEDKEIQEADWDGVLWELAWKVSQDWECCKVFADCVCFDGIVLLIIFNF